MLALAAAAPASHAEGRYVATGDSVAAGIGARTPATGYASLFFDFLKTRSGGSLDELVNRAVPGETSGSMLTGGQLTAARAAIDDRRSDTKVVTVTIGGNDVLAGACPSGYSNPATCPFAVNFETILRRLADGLARDPGDEHLFVTTYYNIMKGTPNEPVTRARLLGSDGVIACAGRGSEVGLHDAISCRGAAHGAVVADAYPPFYASPVNPISPDGIHPNDTGHGLIAAELRAKRTTAPPSRRFTLERTRVESNGRATLSVYVPAPGIVSLRGSADRIPFAARGRRVATRPGIVSVRLDPTAKARAVIARRGGLGVKVTVSYAPVGARVQQTKGGVTLKRSR